MRLRLAVSEKPVLNAPAFACIAKPKEGGENMEQTARRQEQLPGAFNGAITNSQHGRVRWYLVHTTYGKERETCEKVRCIIPHNLMQDAL